MVLRDIPSALSRLTIRDIRPLLRSTSVNGQRQASMQAAAVKEEPLPDFEDLESQSSLSSSPPPEEVVKKYDPVKRAQRRTKELPASRYVS